MYKNVHYNITGNSEKNCNTEKRVFSETIYQHEEILITQCPPAVTPARVWLVSNNMGIIIYSFNLNMSPKMSYGVLECDIVMSQNYMLMTL